MTDPVVIRVVLRVWTAFVTKFNRIMSGQTLQPVQESGEVKILLELLASLLETFQVW